MLWQSSKCAGKEEEGKRVLLLVWIMRNSTVCWTLFQIVPHQGWLCPVVAKEKTSFPFLMFCMCAGMCVVVICNHKMPKIRHFVWKTLHRLWYVVLKKFLWKTKIYNFSNNQSKWTTQHRASKFGLFHRLLFLFNCVKISGRLLDYNGC